MAKPYPPIKLFGVHELAATISVRPNNVSVWNRERPRRNLLPEPAYELACGPIWRDSFALREWIDNYNINGPTRRLRGSLES